MTALHTHVYLDGTDLERGSEAFMRFRLTYSGSLLSSNPLQPDKRGPHKHAIRRQFHKQLKELWATNKFLSTQQISAGAYHESVLPANAAGKWGADKNTLRPMAEILAASYGHDGYGFVPLVRKEISLSCSLRILCLRRDSGNALLPARDIDNRVKTVIDALTMPLHTQGCPLDLEGKPMPPGDDEAPFFYVLLDDDRQVTHLEVETDTALEVSSASPEDESFVRLVISVEIRPYNVNMFNLSFA